MNRKAHSVITLILLLISLLILTFNIQPTMSETDNTSNVISNDLLYSVEPSGEPTRLIGINPTTAEVKTIATLHGADIRSVSQLAFSPGGKLMGIRHFPDNQLYQINVLTGEVTLIGEPNPELVGIPGLAFDMSGNLYGLRPGDDKLLFIDSTTGATIVIGDVGRDVSHTGLAINFWTDELYAIDGGMDGEIDTLLKIDKSTGKATVIGPLEVDWFGVGVEFSSVTKELFSVRLGNTLRKIDIDTAEATLVGVMEGVITNNLAAPWPIITATVDINPNTLNLRSNGKWITAYIELHEGYDVSDIDVSSILLEHTIPVDSDAPTEIGDYDEDGIPDLMVKFDRVGVTEFLLSLPVGDEVTLGITGEVNVMLFEGLDTIKLL